MFLERGNYICRCAFSRKIEFCAPEGGLAERISWHGIACGLWELLIRPFTALNLTVNVFYIYLWIHEQIQGLLDSPTHSIPSKSLTLPSATPSSRKTKPAGSATTGCLSGRSECSPVTSCLETGLICSKPALHNRRRTNEISTTTERWVKASQEVIEMSSQKTCALLQGCVRSSHNECHQEHRPWQPNHVESDDEERDLLAFIVLRVCVRDTENESY